MEVIKLTETECFDVLARAPMGRLGCSLDNQPYVVPLNFVYDKNHIYVFSTYGKKIEYMRANPNVCMQVDEIRGQAQWTSVIANGVYQELPENLFETERAHARKLLQDRHRWWLNALAERRSEVEDVSIMPLFFRIRVESVTG